MGAIFTNKPYCPSVATLSINPSQGGPLTFGTMCTSVAIYFTPDFCPMIVLKLHVHPA